MREALDRLAAVARVRVSYSSESLELNRTVCVSLDSVPVGDVLVELLRGSGVEPVVGGRDHIVLAPIGAPMAVAPERPAIVLDRLVVTGSAMGAARRPFPVAIDILDGERLAARSDGTLTQAFNASVPGLWMWEQSPTSLLARYGSIRGASSFGLSYPKVYIDGVQVANPLLLTRLTPEAIDHIEVIRGPQGAALYGADAISGVANIVMRQETADAGAPRAAIRSGLGLARSDFAANPTVDQDHAVTLRLGSNTRSAGFNLEGGAAGAFIPHAFQRHFSVTGTGRAVGSRSVLTGTLRLFAERAGKPASPLLQSSYVTQPPPGSDSGSQSVLQYTVGTTFKFAQSEWLTHALVAGVDGYSLNGVPDDRSPVPWAANAALLAAVGGADRGTLRWSSVASLSRARNASVDITIAAEQSILRQWDEGPSTPPSGSGPGPSPGSVKSRETELRNNTGFSAQVNTGLYDHVFLTGGLRVERANGTDRLATLPMLGSSWVIEQGVVTVKLRGAFGKGIRWPETAVRDTWSRGGSSANLSPEEQSGIEGGVDLILGRALTLQVTRYDQTASGLIQRVMVSADTVSGGGGGPGPRRIGYQMQNVGEITNRGWEFQGSLQRGPFTLSGTLSLADSRVRRLATGYTGDLAVGDRMLDVPARTMSGTAAWSAASWYGSITAYRASDWISYDRISLVQALGGTNRPSHDFVGMRLRDYWLRYPGVTHVQAAFGHTVRRGLLLTVTGENLLDHQRGEPDNVTVLPGRTISLGLRAEF